MTLKGRDAGPVAIRVATLGLWIASTAAGVAWQLFFRFQNGTASYRLSEMSAGMLLSLIGPSVGVPALLFFLSFPFRRAS